MHYFLQILNTNIRDLDEAPPKLGPVPLYVLCGPFAYASDRALLVIARSH